MKRNVALLCILILVTAVMGQAIVGAQGDDESPVPSTSDDLVKVDVLFVGAHPDDDSITTATFVRYIKDEGKKAGVITATRGEGGGNATGRQLGPSLGIVREAEQRQALGQLGISHLYYLNELDWAFTTSATATEEFWGYEEPLGNLVRLMRVLKPDVVVTMNPSSAGGHGHHQYAAKLATEAFWLAGDPTAFPEQIEEEFIDPWQPLKLYYGMGYGGSGLQVSLEVPTNEYSPRAYMTYADLEANALLFYRSQGFDNFYTVPAPARRLSPETFALGASLLPVAENETSMFAGIDDGIATAPAMVQLEVLPQDFFISQGGQTSVDVVFRNYSDIDLSDVTLSLGAPEGWEVTGESGATDVAAGEETTATFTLNVPADADVADMQQFVGRFDAVDANGDGRYATKPGFVWATPPLSVELQPVRAVEIFRDWVVRVGMEQLYTLESTRIAVGANSTTNIPVILTNRSAEDIEATVDISVGSEEISVDAETQTVTVPAGEEMTVDFAVTVPDGLAQLESEVTLTGTYGDTELSEVGTLQVVPSTTATRVASAPTIDGDLSEYSGMDTLAIPFDNLWQGEADDAADLTGDFSLAYDDEFLYVAVTVQDQTIVSNIAPNDIKGHWRSDSVEITVDPQGPGVSEHTLTTFKTGIFPFDTEGNVQAERDADANQGLISVTAPDMQVASAETDNGYVLEVAIPWNAVPGEISAGDTIGFNILLYDCDKADAAVGENCTETRTAWSAWGQIQGNPRVWGHLTLAE
jgi:LmbE family N-acetylglucosaminyl deacetylase